MSAEYPAVAARTGVAFWLFAIVVGACAGQLDASQSPSPAPQQAPPLTAALEGAPPPPPGTDKVINYDRHGTVVAACAQKSGASPADNQGTPSTEVWITDGRDVWKLSTALGSCDPAWSPDGARLAVAAPDGIWILSGQNQKQGERFTDVRLASDPESTLLVFSRPRWSPDGRLLAAIVRNGTATWVEVMDVASGRRVFKSQPGASDVAWGNDSSSLKIGGRVVPLPEP
jgi:hypothetical protein